MPLNIGQILNNRYRIVKPIAEGGYGAVYRVWDLNMECPRALKENLDLSPRAQTQFKLEAKILDQLSHPQLPHVIDHFVIPGQGQYLVMDFVEGEDLKMMLERLGEPLLEKQAVRWIQQICDAVQYLHDQNPPIIHRDIKPANIKITPGGEAMLVDFGIAKVFDPHQETILGAKGVTPGYSPPEQYGQRSTDARSDVYALGATLYNLLTGTHVPDSVDLMTGSVPPPAPAATLNPDISAATESAMAIALEFDRDQRFQSAADLNSALSEKKADQSTLLISEPAVPQTAIFEAPPTHTQKRGKQDKSGRLTMLILGAAVGVIIILTAILIILWNDNNPFISSDINESGATPSITVVKITQTEKPTVFIAVLPTELNTPSLSATTSPSSTTMDIFTPIPSHTVEVYDLFLCEIDPGEICIYSYGTSSSGLQVVTFKFPSAPSYGITAVLRRGEEDEGDDFICSRLDNEDVLYYCNGPLQPTLQTIFLMVYRSDDQQLIASGEILFLPPPPTPTHTKEPKVDCIGDACDDLQLPTP